MQMALIDVSKTGKWLVQILAKRSLLLMSHPVHEWHAFVREDTAS